MSGGYMILVRTPRLGDRVEDWKEIWFAHTPDMERAVKAVETGSGAVEGAKVTVIGTVRHAVLVDQLGVPEGEARSFVSSPPLNAPTV
jgi:hypothetical protein